MLYLIFGGSASGKSAYAETLAQSLGKNLLYLATMYPNSQEGKERIAKHQAMRQGRNFRTVEWHHTLSSFPHKAEVILLECLGNLLANEMFQEDYRPHVWEEILYGIHHLETLAPTVIVVSNDVFHDDQKVSPETQAYLTQLGLLHQKLGEYGANIIEVVYTIPIILQ